MFETNVSSRLPLFSGQDRHLWSSVSVRLQNPWFCLTCSVIDKTRDEFTQTLLLSDVNQLIEVALRENVTIKYVDLVSPEYINGSGRWKMEPLKQIWHRVNEQDQSWKGYEFVLESGMRYAYLLGLPEEITCNSRLIFKI